MSDEIYDIIYEMSEFEIQPPITAPDIIDKLSPDAAYKLIIYIDQQMEDWNLSKRLHTYFKKEIEKWETQ